MGQLWLRGQLQALALVMLSAEPAGKQTGSLQE
jgi:hypothetical protein